jgi:hypothetical protein
LGGYRLGFGSSSRRHAREKLFLELKEKVDSYQRLPLYDRKFTVGILHKKLSEEVKEIEDGD